MRLKRERASECTVGTVAAARDDKLENMTNTVGPFVIGSETSV